jgi:hypothetical protein
VGAAEALGGSIHDGIEHTLRILFQSWRVNFGRKREIMPHSLRSCRVALVRNARARSALSNGTRRLMA